MKRSHLSVKSVLSALMAPVIALSVMAYALIADARVADDIADSGAPTYYLWGLNTNDPDFGAMSSPTGAFLYDSRRGYYYYDVKGTSGNYCFVISEVSVSGAAAVSSPALSTVADEGRYYLRNGIYRGYACMNIWNPDGDDVRIHFANADSGIYAVRLTDEGSAPTAKPTSRPTSAPATAKPTSSTATTKPTEKPTVPPTGDRVVYCRNTDGWPVVHVYMWNDTDPVQENAKWPGAQMKNSGGNIWSYTLPGSYDNIIFSTGGNRQTGDMKLPGSGYMFDNKTREWSVYDTSEFRVDYFTADLSSPQYSGVGIVLSAKAEGKGAVSYRFSAAKGSQAASQLSAFSSKNSVLWTPKTAGTYTLTCDFRDAAGNTNSRAVTYVIKDALSSASPYIRQVQPLSGEMIAKGSPCAVSVSAAGGLTGTKLLFYKFTLTDSSGKTANVPYYSLSSTYTFTPTTIGKYTLSVSVQGSDNTTVTRDYVYDCVASVPKPVDPAASGAVRGDADMDGEVTILDATRIQRWLASLADRSEIDLLNADSDSDGEVTIIDATHIQRLLAGLIAKL